MNFKKITVLTLMIMVGLVASFGVNAKAAKIKLNYSKTIVELDQELKLELLNIAEDDSVFDIKWTSSNKKVATVEDDGTVTPESVGSTVITAKYNKKKYTCKVTVIDYTGMSNEQKEVISYALKYVGNPYRYGGISLTKGTDCSGFTHSVYKKFGYDLYHNAYQQMKDTKKVSMKNIKPGDLIFYGYSKSSCSHVALYIGNGKVVHASTPQTGIVISDYKYRKYCGVGRVLEEETFPEEETPTTTDDSVTRYAAPQK